MDVWEAIEKRRTIRQFTARVPEPLLRRLIWAGAKAPSASNTQPWEFIIINDQGIIDGIAEQKGKMEGLRGGTRRIATSIMQTPQCREIWLHRRREP